MEGYLKTKSQALLARATPEHPPRVHRPQARLTIEPRAAPDDNSRDERDSLRSSVRVAPSLLQALRLRAMSARGDLGSIIPEATPAQTSPDPFFRSVASRLQAHLIAQEGPADPVHQLAAILREARKRCTTNELAEERLRANLEADRLLASVGLCLGDGAKDAMTSDTGAPLENDIVANARQQLEASRLLRAQVQSQVDKDPRRARVHATIRRDTYSCVDQGGGVHELYERLRPGEHLRQTLAASQKLGSGLSARGPVLAT